jgi:hypothetical protein
MKGQPRISGVYHQGAQDEVPKAIADAQTEDVKKRIWNELGWVVIDPADVDDDWLRQALFNEGHKRYGKRRNKDGR